MGEDKKGFHFKENRNLKVKKPLEPHGADDNGKSKNPGLVGNWRTMPEPLTSQPGP